MNRRAFIQASLAATGLSTAARESSGGLMDVNVQLSRWPLRRVPADDTGALVAKLRKQGVTQAWAGSFDALLHKDLASVNARLAEECRRHGRNFLVAFGSVNPKSPDWEEEFRRCVELHRMPGLRLHPNYHGYKLDDPDFRKLMQLSALRGLAVQIALIMEDERMMHPLLRVEPVNAAPLAGLLQQTPGLRLILLNALGILRNQPLQDLAAAGASFEISMLEGVGGVARLFDELPPQRLLFGSYAPYFYFDSALLKLKESPLSKDQLAAIRHVNARRLLAN